MDVKMDKYSILLIVDVLKPDLSPIPMHLLYCRRLMIFKIIEISNQEKFNHLIRYYNVPFLLLSLLMGSAAIVPLKISICLMFKLRNVKVVQEADTIIRKNGSVYQTIILEFRSKK